MGSRSSHIPLFDATEVMWELSLAELSDHFPVIVLGPEVHHLLSRDLDAPLVPLVERIDQVDKPAVFGNRNRKFSRDDVHHTLQRRAFPAGQHEPIVVPEVRWNVLERVFHHHAILHE